MHALPAGPGPSKTRHPTAPWQTILPVHSKPRPETRYQTCQAASGPLPAQRGHSKPYPTCQTKPPRSLRLETYLTCHSKPVQPLDTSPGPTSPAMPDHTLLDPANSLRTQALPAEPCLTLPPRPHRSATHFYLAPTAWPLQPSPSPFIQPAKPSHVSPRLANTSARAGPNLTGSDFTPPGLTSPAAPNRASPDAAEPILTSPAKPNSTLPMHAQESAPNLACRPIPCPEAPGRSVRAVLPLHAI